MALRKKITMVMLTAVMTLSAAMLHSNEQAQVRQSNDYIPKMERIRLQMWQTLVRLC